MTHRWFAAVAIMIAAGQLPGCADDPTSDGPPRIDASIDEGASASDVFRTIGALESIPSAGIEKVEVDMVDRRVVVRLSSLMDVQPRAKASEMHAARNELLARLRAPDSVIEVTSINWNPA